MAFRFLLVASIIAAAWSLMLLLLELLQLAVGRKFRFLGWRMFVYLGPALKVLGDWVRAGWLSFGPFCNCMAISFISGPWKCDAIIIMLI